MITPPKNSKRRRSESGEAIRRKIKKRATELFIRHGYNGVTFLDLAKDIGINHSLIHYHFGSKESLAEEVLQNFADRGIEENRRIWCDRESRLFDKFIAARDRMYERFILFNPKGKMEHPTGLVSRFSVDVDSISPKMRGLVQATQDSLDQTILEALEIAVERGELVPDTPIYQVMVQISSILYVAGPTARYGWEVTRLDDHFLGTLRMLLKAYGVNPELPEAWPAMYDRKGAGARVRRR